MSCRSLSQAAPAPQRGGVAISGGSTGGRGQQSLYLRGVQGEPRTAKEVYSENVISAFAIKKKKKLEAYSLNTCLSWVFAYWHAWGMPVVIWTIALSCHNIGRWNDMGLPEDQNNLLLFVGTFAATCSNCCCYSILYLHLMAFVAPPEDAVNISELIELAGVPAGHVWMKIYRHHSSSMMSRSCALQTMQPFSSFLTASWI